MLSKLNGRQSKPNPNEKNGDGLESSVPCRIVKCRSWRRKKKKKTNQPINQWLMHWTYEREIWMIFVEIFQLYFNSIQFNVMEGRERERLWVGAEIEGIAALPRELMVYIYVERERESWSNKYHG